MRAITNSTSPRSALGKAALWLGCGLSLALFSTSSQASNCTQMPVSGNLYSIVNFGSGTVVDVANRSTVAGANVMGWDNLGGSNQQFYLRDAGNGYWTIQAAHSGMNLDVLNFSTANGGNIIQWNATGTANQQWLLKQSTTGAFNVVSRHSGKSLTLAGGSRGANIYQNSDEANSSQRWYFNPVNTPCGQGNADGFAGQPGRDGSPATTGGGSSPATVVRTCAAMIAALNKTEPAVVQIPDNLTIDCRTAPRQQAACAVSCPSYQDNPAKFSYRVPVGTQSCTSLGATSNKLVNRTRNETTINVRSNKTLIGLGRNSRVSGASFNLSNSRNVIIRNLTIDDVNPGLVEAQDGITLNNSAHIWLDHLRMRQISDGHVDISNSRNVTLSWNQFDGYNTAVCGNQHHYTSMIQDSQVTLHHNFWNNVSGRNPKMSGAATRGHLYNNHWRNVTYFAVSVDSGAQAKLEANFFENSAKPHWNQSTGLIDGGVESNRYTGISAMDLYKDTGNIVLGDTPRYFYSLDNVDALREILSAKSGPR